MGNVSLADLSPKAQAQAGEQIRAQQKPSKYRNVKTVLDGITFASKREAIRYAALKLEEKAGRIRELVPQAPFVLKVSGHKIGTYIADFIYFRDAKLVVEDVKSPASKTPVYRLKAKLMKALYGIDIVEVK